MRSPSALSASFKLLTLLLTPGSEEAVRVTASIILTPDVSSVLLLSLGLEKGRKADVLQGLPGMGQSAPSA